VFTMNRAKRFGVALVFWKCIWGVHVSDFNHWDLQGICQVLQSTAENGPSNAFQCHLTLGKFLY
jgi:hypothetical protein